MPRRPRDGPDRLEHERGAQVKYFGVEAADEREFRRKDGQATCPECDRKIGFGKGWRCSRCETWFCDEECGGPEDGVLELQRWILVSPAHAGMYHVSLA